MTNLFEVTKQIVQEFDAEQARLEVNKMYEILEATKPLKQEIEMLRNNIKDAIEFLAKNLEGSETHLSEGSVKILKQVTRILTKWKDE